ncbi:MAG: 6-phosphogluconolactonase [Fibrobacterota bacterium]
MNYKRNIEANIIPFKTTQDLAGTLRPALEKKFVALSGGSTYGELFEQWRQLRPAIAENHYLPVDERVVSFESSQSNWGTACRSFFFPLNRHDIKENHPQSVADYARICNTLFTDAPFIFDTVFMGVGDDGHCASIFPGTPAMEDYETPFLATRSPQGIQKRVTLGYSVLMSAKDLIFVISGPKKRQAVKWLVEEDRSRPFIRLLQAAPHARIYLDEDLFALYTQLTDERKG